MKPVVAIADIYGRLTVVRRSPRKESNSYWLCVCRCGTESEVSTGALRSGRTQSCGCLQRERAAANGDGRSKTAEYGVWSGLKARCLNPKCRVFHLYGGRGITIYAPWINDFGAFLGYVGRRPKSTGKRSAYSIERIDTNGNYEPGNVRWATCKEQQNNRRNNVRLAFNGEVLTIAEWATRIGFPMSTVWARYARGLSTERVLSVADLRPGRLIPEDRRTFRGRVGVRRRAA